MSKVSGKDVAKDILEELGAEIKGKNLKPHLAIILAGDNPSSRIYVNNKIKAAKKIGIKTKLFEFPKSEKQKVLQTIRKLNRDKKVHGIIIQYPLYEGWDFDTLVQAIDPQKDVDGFLPQSPFMGATALGVWEMLSAFATHERFSSAEEFLKGKKIVVLGKGRTAGGPTIRLLKKKGVEVQIIDSKTVNPDAFIKKADVVISATGIKNIVNGKNIKKGAYVVGVGVGKEGADGDFRVYGDINEEEVAKIAKLYCPTIGGIGPLTIACLLRNVVESSKRSKKHGTI